MFPQKADESPVIIVSCTDDQENITSSLEERKQKCSMAFPGPCMVKTIQQITVNREYVSVRKPCKCFK